MFQCMLCEDEDVWYPPMEVEKDEYETLLEFLASCGFEDEAMFVDRYYKEDKNGPTTYYHLQVDLQQSGKYQSFSKFVFDNNKINVSSICVLLTLSTTDQLNC